MSATDYKKTDEPTPDDPPAAKKVVGAGLYTVMPSGAGHDAQQMQKVAKSGMIFIPSLNGVSHSPDEFTDHKYVAQGTQILCNALLRLSAE